MYELLVQRQLIGELELREKKKKKELPCYDNYAIR